MQPILVRLLMLATAGLLLALALRLPARRLFGAGPAFSLWLLPVLLAAGICLPAIGTWPVALTARIAIPLDRLAAMPQAHVPLAASILTALWLMGAAMALLRLVAGHVRVLVRADRPSRLMCHALQADAQELDLSRVRISAHGPAVAMAWRGYVLLPADFFERFDASERRLVLRHELAHLRRGDALWNLLAGCVLALLWFHPLAWLALPRYRLDQELACDEAVLRRWPGSETTYAKALLRSTGIAASPAIAPWLQSAPQLKQRLVMIRHRRPGKQRRRVGVASLILLMAGSTLAAQGGTHQVAFGAIADLGYNALHRPSYPAASIRNHEQGVVVLDVLVDADGIPASASYDAGSSSTAAAGLIGAATDAVMQWRFRPLLKNGTAVESRVRVPIEFDLRPS